MSNLLIPCERPQVLIGNIVAVEGGTYGDWTLRYDDGRIIFIDCGYVGATIYEQKNAQPFRAPVKDANNA